MYGPAWHDGDFVFDNGDGRPMAPHLLSSALKRAAKRAGVPDLRLHDLRHAFATMLLASADRGELILYGCLPPSDEPEDRACRPCGKEWVSGEDG